MTYYTEEIRLFTAVGIDEKTLSHLSVSNAYRWAVEICFLENRQDKYADVLRELVRSMNSDSFDRNSKEYYKILEKLPPLA